MVNYFEAQKLLDEVKDGHDHTTANITIALGLVGDFDPDLRRNGSGWWRPSPEGWPEGLFDSPVQGTGTGLPRHHADNSPKN